MMKLIISIIVVISLTSLFFLALSLINNNDGDEVGTITVTIIDHSGTVISQASHDYSELDTLSSILEANYTLTYGDAVFTQMGRILLGINDVNTDFESDFIRISIKKENEEPYAARKGIDNLALYDKAEYVFEVQTIN